MNAVCEGQSLARECEPAGHYGLYIFRVKKMGNRLLLTMNKVFNSQKLNADGVYIGYLLSIAN